MYLFSSQFWLLFSLLQQLSGSLCLSCCHRMPCPGCGQVSYDLDSRAFTLHIRHHCRKKLLTASVPTSAKRPHLTYDHHRNPVVPRNPLMANDTLTSSSFTENPFEQDDCPPNPPKQESAIVTPRPNLADTSKTLSHPVTNTHHDASNPRDKTRKAQCITHGSMHFQIQLVDTLQKRLPGENAR